MTKNHTTKSIIITVLMLIVISINMFCIVNDYLNNHYIKEATVNKVTESLVTATDEDGNIWQFFGDGFNVNDTITLRLATQGTADIKDDVIKKVVIKR